MRITELFSQSEETICETMIPGIVSDELGPATTIDDRPPKKVLFSKLRRTDLPPESLFDDRSKYPYSVLHGMEVTRAVDSDGFIARNLCRA